MGHPNADDRDARLRFPGPPEIVRHAHRTGRIAGHRMYAAVGRARTDRNYRSGFRCQLVEPFARGDRLAGFAIVPEAAPIPPSS